MPLKLGQQKVERAKGGSATCRLACARVSSVSRDTRVRRIADNQRYTIGLQG
jgi:hypothetical protein